MVTFKNEYYLFASKSGGYFHSTDLIHWDLITTKDLPLEDYAPTAVVMNDTLYFMASKSDPPLVIYKTADPKSGQWQIANPSFPIGMIDPDLFVDEDGRLYFFQCKPDLRCGTGYQNPQSHWGPCGSFQ
jgi:xylan 1,4-beta-xylosidase